MLNILHLNSDGKVIRKQETFLIFFSSQLRKMCQKSFRFFSVFEKERLKYAPKKENLQFFGKFVLSSKLLFLHESPFHRAFSQPSTWNSIRSSHISNFSPESLCGDLNFYFKNSHLNDNYLRQNRNKTFGITIDSYSV